MQAAQKHLSTLGEYVELSELHPSIACTFPTIHSANWWIRVHREKLVAAGALIYIAGRLRFHPQKFQQVAIEIGSEAARLRVAA